MAQLYQQLGQRRLRQRNPFSAKDGAQKALATQPRRCSEPRRRRALCCLPRVGVQGVADLRYSCDLSAAILSSLRPSVTLLTE